ncbi:MAG TPA: hypothetical protein VEW04_08135 [Allosphingosinicella sp.]|nr:hypothetical protein [Allosphingosinicella sp.]
MVTPEPPPFRAPNVQTVKNPDNGCAIWGTIGIVLLLIYAASRCSTGTSGTNVADAMNTANADMTNSIAAQTPPPVEPLNAASIARGAAHYRTAFAAESFPGAMIYSQNCYDALTREFTWAKLDRCGAFDQLAARAIGAPDAYAPTSEQDYFQSEAAAGRYLAAATGAGQPADQADQRLSALQAQAARQRAPAPRRPAAANDDGELGNAVSNALDEAEDEAVGNNLGN